MLACLRAVVMQSGNDPPHPGRQAQRTKADCLDDIFSRGNGPPCQTAAVGRTDFGGLAADCNGVLARRTPIIVATIEKVLR